MRQRSKLPDFTHSMTDLMASVAVTFLLLAAIFMLRASAANRALLKQAERDQKKLASVQTIQKDSLEALEKLVSDLRKHADLADAVQADPNDKFLISVEFPEHALYFPVGSAQLVAASEETLVGPLERVVRRVCDIDARLTNSIILEGHTDPQGRAGLDGYQYNVGLSAQRAQTVYFAVRRLLPETTRRCMDSRFTVAGRGPVQPKRFAGEWDDPTRPRDDAADRRVVLKVRFTSGGEALAGAE